MKVPPFDPQTHIPLMEDFYTVQGEGVHSGKAAYFIRLAGCDVGCVWCDVKESWDVAPGQIVSIESLLARVKQVEAKMVVITGGEPAMYDLGPLTQALQQAGCKTHIETSGAYPLTGTWDWICVSPKKFKAPLPEVLGRADELKVIVYHKSDFGFAESHLAQMPAGCNLLLQPEWGKREQMMPLMVEYVKHHPAWRISLQTHKYMGVE